MTGSGPKALEIIDTHDIGAVVLDVVMPEVDGLETLRRIKAEYPDVEVVMFTGQSDEEVILNALRAGAIDYLEVGSRSREHRPIVNSHDRTPCTLGTRIRRTSQRQQPGGLVMAAGLHGVQP